VGYLRSFKAWNLVDIHNFMSVAKIREMREHGGLKMAVMSTLFNRLIEKGYNLHVIYISVHWLNINDAFDLADARNFI
jgi:hypothetical protein